MDKAKVKNMLKIIANVANIYINTKLWNVGKMNPPDDVHFPTLI